MGVGGDLTLSSLPIISIFLESKFETNWPNLGDDGALIWVSQSPFDQLSDIELIQEKSIKSRMLADGTMPYHPQFYWLFSY